VKHDFGKLFFVIHDLGDLPQSIDKIILNYPLQNVRFFYVNVLIPVGAGACAALLIAFLVVLCRCCRRRKLKKVRYFGKVPVVANNIINHNIGSI